MSKKSNNNLRINGNFVRLSKKGYTLTLDAITKQQRLWSRKSLIFIRSEAYKNDDAFLAYLANPAIGEYLQKHTIFAKDFTVEVYGIVGEKFL